MTICIINVSNEADFFEMMQIIRKKNHSLDFLEGTQFSGCPNMCGSISIYPWK